MTSPPPEEEPVIHVDFETRSRAELDEVGGRRYAEHPSTRVVCAVLRFPDDGWCEYTGLEQGQVADEIAWWVERGAPCVAHNAMHFDRFIWAKLGWPEPARWIDTAELAKVAGYAPASLESLGHDLLGVEKDMAGNEITLALSSPAHYYPADAMDLTEAKAEWRAVHPKGCGLRLPTAQLKAARVRELDAYGEEPAAIPPEVLARVVAYCRKDVEIMAALYDGFLRQWLDSDLPGLEQADRALNDRGICFDVGLARLLLDACDGLAAKALEAAGLRPDQAIEVSPARLKARLSELGVDLPDCQADTLQAALAAAPERAQLLIRARQGVSSIAAGKLRAGLLRVGADGKLRDNRNYMGAHTGRWSAHGFQMDNMAKGE